MTPKAVLTQRLKLEQRIVRAAREIESASLDLQRLMEHCAHGDQALDHTDESGEEYWKCRMCGKVDTH